MVEANGLIEIRLGGSGGAFFRGADPTTVGSALSAVLTLDATTERDLNEFRFAFEQENAALAARRAQPPQKARLRELADAADGAADWVSLQEIDLALHELLPAMTGNSVRVAVSIGIHDALKRVVGRTEPNGNTDRLRSEIRELVALIDNGDDDGARRAMTKHLRHWQPDFAPATGFD